MPEGKQCGIVMRGHQAEYIRVDLDRFDTAAYPHLWDDARALCRPKRKASDEPGEVFDVGVAGAGEQD